MRYRVALIMVPFLSAVPVVPALAADDVRVVNKNNDVGIHGAKVVFEYLRLNLKYEHITGIGGYTGQVSLSGVPSGATVQYRIFAEGFVGIEGECVRDDDFSRCVQRNRKLTPEETSGDRPPVTFPDDPILEDVAMFFHCETKKDFYAYLEKFGDDGFFSGFAHEILESPGTPSEKYIKYLAKKILNVFSASLRSVGNSDKKKRVEKLKKQRMLLGNILGFETIKKFVLGSYNESASEDQLKRFGYVYRKALIESYNLENVYSWEGDVVLNKSRPYNQVWEGIRFDISSSSDDVFVQFFLKSSSEKDPKFLDLRFRKKNGGMRVEVVDVILNNTYSIIKTQRDEYQSVLRREGIEYLITHLSQMSGDDD